MHQPIRTCIGCGVRQLKQQLLRVVRSPEGKIEPDPSAKMPGRGAYLCYSADCIDKAFKRKSFERKLKTEVGLEFELRKMLLNFVNGRH